MMNIPLRISIGLVITSLLNPAFTQAQSVGLNGESIVPYKISLSGAWPCAELEISLVNDILPYCADNDGCLMRLVDIIDSDWPEQDRVHISIQTINGPSIYTDPHYLVNMARTTGQSKRLIGDLDADTLIATPDDGSCRVVADDPSYLPELVLKACIENSVCTLRVED